MRTLVISTDAPTVPGPPQGHWTYADWEALPDDGNIYEIIDGVLYRTTAPGSFTSGSSSVSIGTSASRLKIIVSGSCLRRPSAC